MIEYIEREAAKKAILMVQKNVKCVHDIDPFDAGVIFSNVAVEGVPAADVAPVRHGRWVDEYGGKYANHHYRCSVCKGNALLTSYRDGLFSFQTEQKRSKYCPHCGAKMDGEE